jgi:large subunit ribosomal protein L18
MSYKRKNSVKKTNIKGSSERPRLSVFRSNKFIFAQIIDDVAGVTLVSASSLKLDNSGNIDAAKVVGKNLAELAKLKKIVSIVFDRGRYQFKGRVKALADSAREEGLQF